MLPNILNILWEQVKKRWSDPVWSKIIATTIVAIVSALFYGLVWLYQDTKFVVWLKNWAITQTPVANWILVLLALLSLCLAIGVVLATRRFWSQKKHSKKKKPTSYRNYTSDTISGICWRWEYAPPGDVWSLIPYCPNCDLQIEPTIFRSDGRVTFACRVCGIITQEKLSGSEFLKRVWQQICVKLRAEYNHNTTREPVESYPEGRYRL